MLVSNSTRDLLWEGYGPPTGGRACVSPSSRFVWEGDGGGVREVPPSYPWSFDTLPVQASPPGARPRAGDVQHALPDRELRRRSVRASAGPAAVLLSPTVSAPSRNRVPVRFFRAVVLDSGVWILLNVIFVHFLSKWVLAGCVRALRGGGS